MFSLSFSEPPVAHYNAIYGTALNLWFSEKDTGHQKGWNDNCAINIKKSMFIEKFRFTKHLLGMTKIQI